MTLFSFLRAQTPPLLLFLIEMRAVLKGARGRKSHFTNATYVKRTSPIDNGRKATAFTAENAENAKDSPRAVRNAKGEMRNQGERSRRPRSATHVGRGAPRLLRPISRATGCLPTRGNCSLLTPWCYTVVSTIRKRRPGRAPAVEAHFMGLCPAQAGYSLGLPGRGGSAARPPPSFRPGRHGDRLTLDGAEPPLNLRRPPRRAEEEDGGMPPRHPGPKGRGYQHPTPMNRPDPPLRVPTACAVGYRLSPLAWLTRGKRALLPKAW